MMYITLVNQDLMINQRIWALLYRFQHKSVRKAWKYLAVTEELLYSHQSGSFLYHMSYFVFRVQHNQYLLP